MLEDVGALDEEFDVRIISSRCGWVTGTLLLKKKNRPTTSPVEPKTTHDGVDMMKCSCYCWRFCVYVSMMKDTSYPSGCYLQ